MEEVPFVLLALLTVLFVCFLPWLVFKRADHLIGRWCDDNGFKLVSKQLRVWPRLRDPFALTSSWYRPVYRLTIQEGSGKFRTATVSFGDWLLGVLSGQVRVVWDAGTEDLAKVEKPWADDLS